jgi:hypothetical protein
MTHQRDLINAYGQHLAVWRASSSHFMNQSDSAHPIRAVVSLVEARIGASRSTAPGVESLSKRSGKDIRRDDEEPEEGECNQQRTPSLRHASAWAAEVRSLR